jgi:hypothetical protein
LLLDACGDAPGAPFEGSGPVDAVEIVCAGGDTDTIAAMTGALCGARGGAGVLPALGIRRLEDATHMTGLATTLARLSRGPGRRGPAGTLAGSR